MPRRREGAHQRQVRKGRGNMSNDPNVGALAGDAAEAIADAAGAPPLVGDLAASAVRLAVAVVGRDRVQAILDAEFSAAEAVADAAADAVEHQRFGAKKENTTAPATPHAKKKKGGAT